MNALTFSDAIDGYLIHARARRLSPNTITFYQYAFDKFSDHIGTTPLAAITKNDIEAFLADQSDISASTLRHLYDSLSVFWTWATSEHLVTENILRAIAPPRPEQREIQPLTEAEMRALLTACDRSRPYTRPHRRNHDHARPTALRDRAILLTLVDTGLRASELCTLTIADFDAKNQTVTVLGKGKKERTLPLDAHTVQAIWRYLRARQATATAPLFATADNQPLDRSSLRHLLVNLGQRAGVKNVTPHRFRHTFAITYLRNNGDIYTLQRLLGHSSLEMVRRYLAIAETDIVAAHRRASPVANWNL